jgi:hypothetical protein
MEFYGREAGGQVLAEKLAMTLRATRSFGLRENLEEIVFPIVAVLLSGLVEELKGSLKSSRSCFRARRSSECVSYSSDIA